MYLFKPALLPGPNFSPATKRSRWGASPCPVLGRAGASAAPRRGLNVPLTVEIRVHRDAYNWRHLRNAWRDVPESAFRPQPPRGGGGELSARGGVRPQRNPERVCGQAAHDRAHDQFPPRTGPSQRDHDTALAVLGGRQSIAGAGALACGYNRQTHSRRRYIIVCDPESRYKLTPAQNRQRPRCVWMRSPRTPSVSITPQPIQAVAMSIATG